MPHFIEVDPVGPDDETRVFVNLNYIIQGEVGTDDRGQYLRLVTTVQELPNGVAEYFVRDAYAVAAFLDWMEKPKDPGSFSL